MNTLNKAEQYFKEHSIDPQFAKDNFGLVWDSSKITIPIYDIEGNLLFCKYRHLTPTASKFTQDVGAHPALFSLHKTTRSGYVILCEGEPDAIRLWQAGFPAITPTSGVKTISKPLFEPLKGKDVYVCLDTDEAGTSEVRNYCLLLKEVEARPLVLTLPDKYKDVCEFFVGEEEEKKFEDLMLKAEEFEEWEKLNTPEEFSLLTSEQITKMEFPKQLWLIDGFLYGEGFCFIYGAEGTGKSLIALSIAKALSEGKDWLDHFHVPAPINILILDKENPISILARRLQGLSASSPNVHFLKYPERFQLTGEKGFSEFAETLSSIVKRESIKLIIIDSFVDLMEGNESSSADTQMFFDALRQLFPGLAFLVLHHENKPSQGVFRNDSQRLRGSSNINAQTMTMFRLESKSKTELTIKQTKARDAMKLDKFLIRMVIEREDESNTKVTGFEYVGEIIENEDPSKELEIENSISEMATERPVSKKQILDLAQGKGISEKTVQRTIKKMLEEGSLNEIKKGREKWYVLGLLTDYRVDGEDEYKIMEGE